MDKVRRKINVLRVLQVVFYALGFPLFVHMVMLTAKPIQESYLASDLGAYMAIIIAAVMWVVVILAQLLFRAICRKNRMARAVWVALIATVITIAPVVYSDFMLKSEYEALVDKYVEEEGLKETDFYTYEKAITKYTEITEELNDDIDEYIEVFNLAPGALEGKNYGGNGDGSIVTPNEEDQAFYSPNGMFSDGYLFSLKQAIAVQKAYYSNKLAYEAEGKDIDMALAEALLELETNPSSDWNKYKNGASESSFKKEGFTYITSSDEYELAYGEDGYAKKFYVTDDRLDAIASVIGGNLGACDAVGDLLNILTGTGLVKLPDGLNLDTLLTEDLTVDQLIDTINALGLGKTLAGLIGTGADSITKDDLMGLLEGYSNYQSPSTYPIFYFLEDDALQEYAYANYYGTIHGGKVGAVLVGENVGLMNLDNMSGTKNPYTASGLIKTFKIWDAQTELINEFYPMFAVRAIALKMSAAIVFCLLAAYWFTAKIDDQYAKLAVVRK